MLVSIESENVEILPYLSLEAGNITGKSVQVRPETKKITVLFNLPPEEVEKLKGGTHRYNADLIFTTEDTALLGDFKSGETTLPIEFQIVKPKSKVPLFIAAGIAALIALIKLVKDILERSKSPQFKLVMEVRDEFGFESISLLNIKPTHVQRNHYKVSVGSSPTNEMVVARLPEEAFDILGIREKDSMEYYIQPKTTIILDSTPQQVQFKMSTDYLEIGDAKINFIIGK
jgi:hypothetical protein